MTGKPLIAILGPTAVGKTSWAIDLALALDGEIVNADSRQIYRHMNVGTAKPTPEQRTAVPHHLLDIVSPDDNLSLAQYQRLAYTAIDDIHTRNGVPLLVGGTGLYITAVVEGWTIPEVPPNDALRVELEAFAQQHGAEALHARLHNLDPAAAAQIDARNVRRVIRALEIVMETGQPMDYATRKQPPPYRIRQYGLTMEREFLYQRADMRVDAMIQEGFIDEVRHLLDMGYSDSLPSMSGLGYKELAAYLRGDLSLEEAITDTKKATRNFIRRQYTWFRGHDQGIVWMDVTSSCAADLSVASRAWLNEDTE